MTQVRMDIETIVVGGGPVASMVVLRPRNPRLTDGNLQLPIQIGLAEASAISTGMDDSTNHRPFTHDLLKNVVSELGSTISSVGIDRVEGATFFAHVTLIRSDGEHINVDARPSDAIALAVRTKAPIFVNSDVLETAAYPDFTTVRKDEEERELKEFHDFVETLSPEDFLIGNNGESQKS